jgi:tripartite ATP-independent transporter DctP family solute receptor
MCAVAAGLLVSTGCGKKEETIVLKAADVHEQSYPTTKGLFKMKELLEKWTEGRITVKVYHSGQLGAEKETIEQTQFGAIDINRVSISPVSQVVPEFKVFALPYIFRDRNHMHNVLDGELGKEMMRKLEEHKLVGLGYYDSGQRSFYTAKKPVQSMEDLEGLKIRVQKAEIMLDMARAVGASPTPMAFEEVYSALQTGVIDGAENNLPSYVAKGHYEVATYYTMDAHSRIPELLLFSKATWDKLSEEDQKLIRKAAEQSVPYQRQQWQKRVDESITKAKEAGCEIITDIDKGPFVEAMDKVYEKHAADLQQYVERIRNVE